MLPESGRTNLVKQVIASRAGQSKVAEFYPEPTEDVSSAAQQSDATLQVAAMKLGVPPVLVPTQNPLIYAAVFLQAAEAAVQSVQQGANPAEVVGFLDLAIPAIAQHVQRMAQDKTRADVIKELIGKLQRLKQFADKVKEQIAKAQEQQQEQQAEMQQMQNGQDPETQIGLAKVQARHQVDMAKLQATLGLKAQKQQADLGMAAHRQAVDVGLSDADTAAAIRRKNAEAAAKIAATKAAAAAKPAENGKK
jgi:hypothetical protein